eukprot:CCRYP_008272-RA/>CCRYP_008272-RA protein AED:0.14 eAED:0.19 QI:815/0/0.5/1/0/0/2/0/63
MSAFRESDSAVFFSFSVLLRGSLASSRRTAFQSPFFDSYAFLASSQYKLLVGTVSGPNRYLGF